MALVLKAESSACIHVNVLIIYENTYFHGESPWGKKAPAVRPTQGEEAGEYSIQSSTKLFVVTNSTEFLLQVFWVSITYEF